MEDDGLRTPTRSEIDTFKVLANPEFASIRKNEPGGFSPKREQKEIFDDNLMAEESFEPRQGERYNEHDRIPEERQTESEKIAAEPEGPLFPAEDRHKEDRHKEDSHKGDTPRSERRTYEESYEDHKYVEEKPKGLSEEELLKLKAQMSAEVAIEKEALLYEIEMLEKQGLIKLQRKLSMDDSLEAIQYQYDRANMIISTQQTVEWSKNGIKMGSTMLETLARKFGVTYIDGFSNNLCKDMNKFNAPLTKMVRKYWRRGTSSPEMELGMIVFSSLAMTVMANKGLGGGAKEPKEASAVRPPNFTAEPKLAGPVVSAPGPSGLFGLASEKKMPSAIPEWARSAMNAPLPKHFAQQTTQHDTFPELARGPPAPIFPVMQSSLQGLINSSKDASSASVVREQPREEAREQPREQHREQPRELPREIASEQTKPSEERQVASLALEGEVKRLTLASPRSSRRRRETTVELNLDE